MRKSTTTAPNAAKGTARARKSAKDSPREQVASRRRAERAAAKASHVGNGGAGAADGGEPRAAGRAASVSGRAQDGAKRRATPREFVSAHKRPLLVAAVVLVCVAMLYSPTQDWYCAWRDSQALEATLDATNQVNEQTSQDIGELMTEEGIEDKARELGYVKEGETTVVVTGLEEDDAGTEDDQTADVPWYLSLLDVVFAYSAA